MNRQKGGTPVLWSPEIESASEPLAGGYFPVATSKKARAKAVSKRPKMTVKKKAVAKARPNAPGSSALKDRLMPETLRLKSFTPSLTVNDLARSLAFYEGGLGFIVGERWKDGEVLLGVMLKAGACELGLSQDDWKMGKDRRKGEGFRIWCDTAQDLDAIAARLKAAGFPLKEEPADHPAWGVRSFAVDDPDGFHITIARDI
jgi:catechol 2,3-dioxygenase-like lactoylglutathione lyase family enzyme